MLAWRGGGGGSLGALHEVTVVRREEGTVAEIVAAGLGNVALDGQVAASEIDAELVRGLGQSAEPLRAHAHLDGMLGLERKQRQAVHGDFEDRHAQNTDVVERVVRQCCSVSSVMRSRTDPRACAPEPRRRDQTPSAPARSETWRWPP